MYHIFLIIAAISSQNQFTHIKQQFEKKIELRGSEQKSANISTNILTAKTQIKNNQEAKGDIISQLNQEVATQENATKPDLESLGLDPIDDIINTTKNGDNGFLTGNLTNITPIITDNKVDNKNNLLTKIEKIITPEIEMPKTEKQDSSIVIKTDIPNKQLVEVNKETDQKQIEGETKKFISKIIEKPVAEIKKFFSKEPLDGNKIIIDTTPKSTSDEKESIKQQPVKNKQKTIANKSKKQRAVNNVKALKIKEKDMLKELTALKQKYLLNNDENDYYQDIFDNVTYSSAKKNEYIAVVIPKRKIPPQFINDNVPPPLLNRFRGQENRHHPFYISYPEKVNFMFKAIKDGRMDDLNSILNLVDNPNIKNSSGDTLLTFAILMRKYMAISSLIVKGADSNLANNLGYTPLNIAIEMGDYKTASILVDVGNAKIDFIDDVGITYLMQAVRVGSLPIVDLLISRGIDVNIADNVGNTALAVAYQYKQDIIAQYLLKYGAKNSVPKFNNNSYNMINDLFYKWR